MDDDAAAVAAADDDDGDEFVNMVSELAFVAVVFIALIIAAGILCVGVVFIRRFNSSLLLRCHIFGLIVPL